MLVLDASAVVAWLLATPKERAVDRRHAAEPGPHQTLQLMDVEVVHALRRLWMSNTLSEAHAARLVSLLADLPLERRAHGPLIRRAWELRHNVSAYDATYVALAEALGATLVTCDRRLGNAPGVRAPVEVI